MECACIDAAEDGDRATMLKDEKRVARKPHDCIECGRMIERGEKYRFEVSVFDGKVSTHKTCIDCDSLRSAFLCSWYWGYIREAIRNTIFDNGCDISESKIAELTEPARTVVCEWIEECWEWSEY